MANSYTLDIIDQVKSALELTAKGRSELALRRCEADLRGEIATITHRLDYSLRMRDILVAEHAILLKQLEKTTGDVAGEVEVPQASGSGKVEAPMVVDDEADAAGDASA